MPDTATKQKPRILLNWWYDRTDLLRPFIRLQDQFEFIFIFYKKPSDKDQGIPFKLLYWDNYSSPYQLLKEVQPDKVVFMNIDDGTYQVALNIACKHTGVPTYILDHGMRTFVDHPGNPSQFEPSKVKPLKFLFSSLRPGNLHYLPHMLKLISYKLYQRNQVWTDPYLIPLKRPSYYLLYTRSNARFFINRDKAPADRIKLTGDPSVDVFFSTEVSKTHPDQGKYYLLLDQPLLKSKLNYLTLDQRTEFLLKLRDFCVSQGKKLVIKLHPLDFGEQHLFPSDPENITFIERMGQEELIGLIYGSAGLFGYYSNLLIPAMVDKKTHIFDTHGLAEVQKWREIGIARVLNYFTFQPSDIDFENFVLTPEAKEAYIDEFLYKTDGRSLERIGEYLSDRSDVV